VFVVIVFWKVQILVFIWPVQWWNTDVLVTSLTVCIVVPFYDVLFCIRLIKWRRNEKCNDLTRRDWYDQWLCVVLKKLWEMTMMKISDSLVICVVRAYLISHCTVTVQCLTAHSGWKEKAVPGNRAAGWCWHALIASLDISASIISSAIIFRENACQWLPADTMIFD